mmetsp:Transcript_5171/g.12339  ORF Transcript_5171/g.12339 Transcript_5171/m.12339 type:complete len:312 (-) Transcript_5171:1447-2382(-)
MATAFAGATLAKAGWLHLLPLRCLLGNEAGGASKVVQRGQATVFLRNADLQEVNGQHRPAIRRKISFGDMANSTIARPAADNQRQGLGALVQTAAFCQESGIVEGGGAVDRNVQGHGKVLIAGRQESDLGFLGTECRASELEVASGDEAVRDCAQSCLLELLLVAADGNRAAARGMAPTSNIPGLQALDQHVWLAAYHNVDIGDSNGECTVPQQGPRREACDLSFGDDCGKGFLHSGSQGVDRSVAVGSRRQLQNQFVNLCSPRLGLQLWPRHRLHSLRSDEAKRGRGGVPRRRRRLCSSSSSKSCSRRRS